MRSNVECRRCGCGAIIGLRESCAKCVAAQRARLHASGVCHMGRRFVDAEQASCSLQESAIDAGMCGVNSVMRGDDLQAKSGLQHVGFDEVAMFDAGKYEAIVAACDQLYAGTWAEDEGVGKHQPVVAAECDKHGGAIMTGVRRSDGTLEVTGNFQIPAIGEVVSWEVAKADMQARPEARYRMSGERHLYRVDYDVEMASRHGTDSWESVPATHGLAHCQFVREA